MESNFMAILEKCPKCEKEYMIAYQSSVCPHKGLVDLMETKQPTQEQIKEFWEWCGFKEITSKEMWRFETYSETNHWWEAHDGRRYKDLPEPDLNNLFKLAVPELQKKMKNWKAVFYNWIAGKEVDALSLFWAIYAVIDKSPD